jgi:hypothetical protein
MQELVNTFGHIVDYADKSYIQLKYSKHETIKISKYMYYAKDLPCLKRKRLKIEKILGIIGKALPV